MDVVDVEGTFVSGMIVDDNDCFCDEEVIVDDNDCFCEEEVIVDDNDCFCEEEVTDEDNGTGMTGFFSSSSTLVVEVEEEGVMRHRIW